MNPILRTFRKFWSPGQPLSLTAFWASTLAVAFIAALPPFAHAQTSAIETPVRILLEEGATTVLLRGLDLTLTDRTTLIERTFSDQAQVKLEIKDGHFYLGRKRLPGIRYLVSSPAGTFMLNDVEQKSFVELRIDDGVLRVIAILPLEQYLVGTVAGEMPANWPLEALKAQAVVSRSYAAIQLRRNSARSYDLTSDTRDQVFVQIDQDHQRILQAVRLTRGIVLSANGEVVETFFHSTCGGATERAINVWPAAAQSFPTVECGFCSLSPASRWTLKLSPEELATQLKAGGFKEDKVVALDVKRRSESGRAVLIEARGQLDRLSLDGNTFRRLLGYTVLKSTRFAVRLDEGSYIFEGQGYGHGVGLCQWGARGMALQGRTAEEILDFYYPGTTRVRLEVQAPASSSFGDFYPARLEP